MSKRLFFTVTNDLSYDQRMIRICTSLAKAGYSITLVGNKKIDSIPLSKQPYHQRRLPMWFRKGKLFYAEYNLRLLFYLLFQKMDAICAIDLDTILPCYTISTLKRIPRVYDAHELFCEMKEVVSRPVIYKWWKRVEEFAVPKFRYGYTVNSIIAATFYELYGVSYDVVRSVTVMEEFVQPNIKNPFILYQGAVNEGRSFETLIPAFQWISVPLIICGDGNFMAQAKLLVEKYKLQKKVIFKGKIPPEELKNITRNATIGVTIFENTGKSNYYSLANRFFDYLHAGLPQLCVDYPAYKEINNLHEIAVLVKDLSAENLASQLNGLLNDKLKYQKLQQNCLKARTIFNWQNEEVKLLAFYASLMKY